MDSIRLARLPAAIGALALIVLPGRVAADEALIDKGREIAEDHCIRCHVVRDDSPFTGIGSTPSFRLLVTALPDWRERFETFYERRPHPSIIYFRGFTPLSEDEPPNTPVDLELADVEAIVAFAESLHEKYEAEGDDISADEVPDPMLEAGPDAGPGPGPGPAPGPGSAPGSGSGSGGGPATVPDW